MDGDGSYNPNAIIEMKSLIGDFDIVFPQDTREEQKVQMIHL